MDFIIFQYISESDKKCLSLFLSLARSRSTFLINNSKSTLYHSLCRRYRQTLVLLPSAVEGNVFRSVCLSVCLFVCLCARLLEKFRTVFDNIFGGVQVAKDQVISFGDDPDCDPDSVPDCDLNPYIYVNIRFVSKFESNYDSNLETKCLGRDCSSLSSY